MDMQPWKLSDTCLHAAREVPYDVAVFPVASTEAHGQHLPYATDAIETVAIAEAACAEAWQQGAKVLLLPCMPYGVNENTLGFPWTVSVRPSTLFAVLEDVVSSLEEHGLRKLLVLNGHGGNELQPALREMCRETAVTVFLCSWYTLVPELRRELFPDPGEHADQMETSLLLHLCTDLVHLEWAGEQKARPAAIPALERGELWLARPWDRLTHDSGLGNPHNASADKGAQYLAGCAERLGQILVEVAAAEVDELFPYREG